MRVTDNIVAAHNARDLPSSAIFVRYGRKRLDASKAASRDIGGVVVADAGLTRSRQSSRARARARRWRRELGGGVRQHPGSLSDDSRARGRQRDLLGPPPGRRRQFHFFREIRFGAAAIAASVSGATGSGRMAALRLLADVAIGATMELGRSWRTLLLMMLLLRPRGAGEPPGHRQQGALKDQRFRSSFLLFIR